MADTKPTEAHLRNRLVELEDWAELVAADADRERLELATSVLAWVLGDGDGPELPEPDWCQECEGRGGWSSSIDDAHGRTLDLDHDCPRCDGSRVEP